MARPGEEQITPGAAGYYVCLVGAEEIVVASPLMTRVGTSVWFGGYAALHGGAMERGKEDDTALGRAV